MSNAMLPHGSSTESDDSGSDTLDDLLSLLCGVANTESFKSIRSEIQQNAILQRKIMSLEAAFEMSATTVAKKQAEIEEVIARHEQETSNRTSLLQDETERSSKALKELASEKAHSASKNEQIMGLEEQLKNLTLQIKAKDLRIAELGDVEELKSDLEIRLSGSQDALKAKSEQLTEASRSLELVQSLVFHLDTVQSSRDKICGALDRMFNDALQLISDWLQGDFDESRLTNVEGWEALRDHSSISRAFPLPQSNSASGKAMRIAAGLSIYARALAKHVMKSTNILHNDETLDALTKLERQNPEQAAYVRAVLLKAFPEIQKRENEKQASLVVTDVVRALGWCVPSKDRGHFQSSVEKVTTKIADSWTLIQTLEETIKASFSTDFTEDWMPLPTKPAVTTKASATSAHKNKQQEKQHQGDTQERTERAPVIYPVFPSFICIGSKHATDSLLLAGYGLTETQINKAREEFSRRPQRKAVRHAGLVPRQRRNSVLFQSAGGSNGLKNE